MDLTAFFIEFPEGSSALVKESPGATPLSKRVQIWKQMSHSSRQTIGSFLWSPSPPKRASVNRTVRFAVHSFGLSTP